MRKPGEREAVRAVVRWAGHPGTLTAVLVLLFNDHVGKRLWPGAVTGKVSDLAWMLVSPVVLALLLAPLLRLRGDWPAIVGLTGTAVMFVVAKSGAAGGELASRIWSSTGVPSRIQGDRTDLLALPVLAVSWWLWTRARVTRRPWQWLAVAVVPLAVAAMVATSETGPSAYSLEWGPGGLPVLGSYSDRWTTPDGGATWTPADEVHVGDVDPDGGRPHDAPCTAAEPLRCFRLLGSTAPIEVSEDGGREWRLAFDPGPSRRRVPESSPSVAGAVGAEPSAAPTGNRYRNSAELLVVTTPDGWVVLANYPGRGLVRGTQDGSWSLQEYPVHQSVAVPKESRSATLGLPVAVAVGYAAVLAGLGTQLLSAIAPDGRRRLIARLLLRQGLILLWVRLAAWLGGGELLGKLPGVLTLCLVPTLWLAWLLWRDCRPSLPSAVVLAALGLGFTLVGMRPYFWWADIQLTTWSEASWQAFAWALLATAVGAIMGALPWHPSVRPPARIGSG
ncbi:hypothetical protein [Kitasatospora sp. NPDC057223]|uniref:hypothetical protein n=1 Tax=Kitasatospora sp. NPDC057223 TaxID=3346055 RepID=UPI00362E1925